ncbi:S8 family serine peptidase [Phormidium tenue FACHB-886]|nr:S8 family serine peptidase [Phormidium tenue FACHB-886]
MGKIDVLIEVQRQQPEAFEHFRAAMDSEIEALRQGENLVADLGGMGLEVLGEFAPVPMFAENTVRSETDGFAAFAAPTENPDVFSETIVVTCQVERSLLSTLRDRQDVQVFPNSLLTLFSKENEENFTENLDYHPFDLAPSSGGVDCRIFRPAVTRGVIRTLLGVARVWSDGFRGQNIIVGIIDEGINGEIYPVVGGFIRPNNPRPGSAGIGSHGSMCAADVLVAAPAAKLYDYPFLGQPRSGGALAMFQEVLDQRRKDGTPHITNNSYGFIGRPSREDFPDHEIYDLNHPLHRKIREVVASGCPTFFAAGNCGEDCPSTACHVSGIGPGKSIHASNSLEEVITVAAVNSMHERIGYSSQGPGNFADGFEEVKPEIAAYSHFFGNFGPGRPAGGDLSSFDNGTSAATPVAAGVGALLLSAFPNLTPQQLKDVLIRGAINIGTPGWDAGSGFGIINAAVSYTLLRNVSI